MKHLQEITQNDLSTLEYKEGTYKGSWKKRGGVGAFMMIARKWDRIENIAHEENYDIFTRLAKENHLLGRDGSLLSEIRDLRCYLLLVEAEYLAQEYKKMRPGTPEDGGHHAGLDP